MKSYSLIHLLMAGINILVLFLFIVAAFSDAVSPEKSLFFSYLGLLFPFIVALLFIFLIYWLLMRKWMLLFLVICSFLICWKPVSGYLPVHPYKKEIPRDNVIKFLTYNVMGFSYRPHEKNKPNPVIQYIIDSKADIVCMQEYIAGTAPNHSLTEEKIAKALNMYPYHYSLPLVKYQNYSVGLAIYSKYPILKSWKVRYDSSFNGSSVHEIEVNGKKLIVVNNHLESFKLTMEDRSKYADFLKNINSDTFDDLRGTVQRKLGAAYLIRAEQADIISDEIRKLKADYVIVCGDFNDTPISYSHRTIQGTLVDAFIESGNGLGVTYNQNFFWFRIDHILHSANMKSYRTTVDKISLSDHYPVWSYLEMN